MTATPDPLAEATARREQRRDEEVAAYDRMVQASRHTKPTHLAEMERLWREARQRLDAAWDAELRLIEGR